MKWGHERKTWTCAQEDIFVIHTRKSSGNFNQIDEVDLAVSWAQPKGGFLEMILQSPLSPRGWEREGQGVLLGGLLIRQLNRLLHLFSQRAQLSCGYAVKMDFPALLPHRPGRLWLACKTPALNIYFWQCDVSGFYRWVIKWTSEIRSQLPCFLPRPFQTYYSTPSLIFKQNVELSNRYNDSIVIKTGVI